MDGWCDENWCEKRDLRRSVSKKADAYRYSLLPQHCGPPYELPLRRGLEYCIQIPSFIDQHLINIGGVAMLTMKAALVWGAVLLTVLMAGWPALVSAQTVSGVRAFGGGVGPLFGLVGPGNLYLDNQGTQGYMYTPGNNFESYSFRNPATGQFWTGAVMTLGPQLSIGIIQGANQSGSPVVLAPPPRDVTAALVTPFSLRQINPLAVPITPVQQFGDVTQLVGAIATPAAGSTGLMRSIPLAQPIGRSTEPLNIESSLLNLP
jgi:hypothetical protein